MSSQHYQYSFTSSKSPADVFSHLINPRNWWVGLYGEKIEGESKAVNDQFSFLAGDGVHYSNQQLTTAEADKKIVWLVTESNLSFLKNTNEWAGTHIGFDIGQEGGITKVTFNHEGLIPDMECYENCTGAWTRYMQNLAASLK